MAKYYPDSDLIIGKKYYEVAFMKHVEGSVDDDFESVFFDSAVNYRHAVFYAKQASMKHDACDVICYTATEDTSYEQIFREQYIKGKKQIRLEC